MGVPDDVMPHALTYMRIYFGGILFTLLYNVGAGILRAVGDARRPLYFLAFTVTLNGALDYLMVIPLNMGIAGAAYATVISQAVSAILVIMLLSRTKNVYRVSFKKIRFDTAIFRRVVRIGIPAGLQSSMFGISNIFVQAGVNSFGTVAIAAWVAYGRYDSVFWMTMSALGVSITTFVGQNFGAQRYDRIRKCVRVGFLIGALITALYSTVMPPTARTVLGLFTPDPAVIETGMQILHMITPFYIAYLSIEILSGALRGAGDTLIPMFILLVTVCIFRASWVSFLVPIYRDIRMIAVSYPAAWVLATAAFAVYYLRGNWLRRRIQITAFPEERQEP